MTTQTRAELQSEIEQLQRRIVELDPSITGADAKWLNVVKSLPDHVLLVDLDGKIEPLVKSPKRRKNHS